MYIALVNRSGRPKSSDLFAVAACLLCTFFRVSSIPTVTSGGRRLAEQRLRLCAQLVVNY